MKYAPLPTIPEKGFEALSSDPQSEDDFGQGENHRTFLFSFHRRNWYLLANGALLLMNLCLAASVLFWSGRQSASSHTSVFTPSPAQALIEQELRTFDIQSRFSEDPSPEVDQAWDDLIAEAPGFGISASLFREINPSFETGVQLTGDPEGRYLATLDVVHQLHCVNLLRKGLHPAYYAEEESIAKQDQPVLVGHMGHCIEVLRQAVMCHGDVAVLSYNWLKGEPMPKPNFKTVHSCQKWDNIRDWSEKENITSYLASLSRPDGVTELDKPL